MLSIFLMYGVAVIMNITVKSPSMAENMSLIRPLSVIIAYITLYIIATISLLVFIAFIILIYVKLRKGLSLNSIIDKRPKI